MSDIAKRLEKAEKYLQKSKPDAALKEYRAIMYQEPLFFFLMIRPPPISPLFPYTPLSRSGSNILEVSFPTTRGGGEAKMKALPGFEAVSGHDTFFRGAPRNGPATTMALLEAAAQIHLP